MKRIKIALICAVFAVFAAFALIGCGSRTFKITFDGNGGTPAQTEVVAVDGAALPGVSAPSRDGYTFTGWYKSSDCNESLKWRVTDKVKGSMTLYAGWTQGSYITVKYELGVNGETVENAPQDVKVKSGSLVFEPSDPTRNGYVFKQWYKDSSFNEPFDFSFDTVNSDTTLYAKWVRVYNVTLKTPDGKSTVFKVEDGKTLSEITVPPDNDKMFIGFFDDADYSNKLEFWEEVTEDITVFAKLVAPTDRSLYSIRGDKDDPNSGRVFIYTKEHMDELVLPKTYNGVKVRDVVFDAYEDGENDGKILHYLDVGTLIFPSSISTINLNSGYPENISVEAYEIEYSHAARYVSYGGCLYDLRSSTENDKDYETRNLFEIPSAHPSVINVMPGATIQPSWSSEYIYRFQTGVTEFIRLFGLYGVYRQTIIVVPDEYYDEYTSTESLTAIEYLVIYPESELEDAIDALNGGNA